MDINGLDEYCFAPAFDFQDLFNEQGAPEAQLQPEVLGLNENEVSLALAELSAGDSHADLEDSASSTSGFSSDGSEASEHGLEPQVASPDSFAELLNPALDMSTALQLLEKRSKRLLVCKEDNKPLSSKRSRLSKSSKRHAGEIVSNKAAKVTLDRDDELRAARVLPPRGLRKRLVRLYFRHVHPLCPVIDEFEFAALYNEVDTNQELGSNVNMLLFQSMMFAASGHISEADLQKSPFQTVHDLQSAYFRRAKTLYTYSSDDEMILVQAAVLLSYWSPYNSEFQVNSYWIDRAFFHARQLDLCNSDLDSGALSCRRRIIWWCCLVRDRLVSLGLRRPYRLQEKTSIRGVVRPEDFGVEACHPTHTNLRSKEVQIEAFIALTKLSEIMADIAYFESSNNFRFAWSGDWEQCTVSQDDIDEVHRLLKRIENWKEDYEKVSQEFASSVLPRSSKIPIYMLRILGDSLIATLFQPYLDPRVKGSIKGDILKYEAFAQVKAACSGIAKTAADIHSHCSKEDVPLAMICWLAFPLAVFRVEWNLTGGKVPPDFRQQLRDLELLVDKIGERFLGADYLSSSIREATQTVKEDSAGHEGDVLDVVAKFINLRLSKI